MPMDVSDRSFLSTIRSYRGSICHCRRREGLGSARPRPRLVAKVAVEVRRATPRQALQCVYGPVGTKTGPFESAVGRGVKTISSFVLKGGYLRRPVKLLTSPSSD